MIPSQSTKITYQGDGTTKVFPFNFHYISGSDVKVAIYEIATDISTILEHDYYVDTVANTVSYPGYAPGQEPAEADQPPVLTDGYKIVIYRDTPITQEVDLGDKYPLNTLEKMDDKAILIIQEIMEKLNRCVMASVGSTTTAQEIIDQIHEDRLAVSEDKVITGQYKDSAEASATEAYNYLSQAITCKDDTAISAATANSAATTAVSNAQAAINANTAAQAAASAASDSATQAATSAGGSQFWADRAYQYTEPLRHALGNMYEYDENGNVMLVEDPLAATDPNWEVDEDGNVMLAE